MNITKKLVAVGAILGAVTLANAQTVAVPATETITLSITNEQLAHIKVVPETYTDNSWIWNPAATALTAITGADPKLLGVVLVETNMPQWDVTIKSANAGSLKNTAALKALISGTTATEVKTQIYTCIGDDHNTTSPCTPTITSGKLAALTTSGVSIASSLGYSTGFTTANMGPAPATTLLGATGTTPAPIAHIGIYGGLYTSSSVVKVSNLVGAGTFTDELTFTLISKY